MGALNDLICSTLGQVCRDCHVDFKCCFESRPPLTRQRIKALMAGGMNPQDIEFQEYKRLKLKPDGFCAMFDEGKCKIHSIKPETCIAGPFTFDVKEGLLQIFLKLEGICPMAKFLKENSEAYDLLFKTALASIKDLVIGLPKNELAAILKIEEPDTELVGEIDLKELFL